MARHLGSCQCCRTWDCRSHRTIPALSQPAHPIRSQSLGCRSGWGWLQPPPATSSIVHIVAKIKSIQKQYSPSEFLYPLMLRKCQSGRICIIQACTGHAKPHCCSAMHRRTRYDRMARSWLKLKSSEGLGGHTFQSCRFGGIVCAKANAHDLLARSGA